MRKAVLSLCLCVAVQAAGAGSAVEATRLAQRPLIEVVSFGVAPVTGVDPNGSLQPKPGDIVHRGDDPQPGGDSRVVTEARVRAGESWADLFARLGLLLSGQLQRQLSLLPTLVAGKYVRSVAGEGNRTAEVEYVVSDREAYTIRPLGDVLQVVPHASDPRLVERIRADASKASLFTATDAIGLPDAIVLQLAEIFAGDVDFHRELHHGYRCTLVYEVHYRDGHIDRPGRILAAEFVIRDRQLQAYYFEGGPGKPGYFTETGRSMRKVFRRSPVKFSRVTSEYTLARFHPVLQVWRAHRGTDYAAPVGTPVLATSDGIVEFAGERGEFGNLLVLAHRDRYQTYYGHLSGFAEGIAEGMMVEQGQIVGYVGMTGLTTGPHLHYEYRVRNGDGDWASVPEPEVREAPSAGNPEFFGAVKTYRDQLAVAAQAHVVTLD